MGLLDFLSSGLTAGTQGASAYLQGQQKGRKEEDERTRQVIADLRQKRIDEQNALMAQAQIGNYRSLDEDRKAGPARDAAKSELDFKHQQALAQFQVDNRVPKDTAITPYQQAQLNLGRERLSLDRNRAAQGGVQSLRAVAVYKKQTRTLANLKDAIKTYRDQLEASGTEVMPGEGKSLLTGAYANLKLLAKDAAELGALTGPDVVILEELFNDPTKLTTKAWDVATFGGQKKALKAQLDQYESIIDGNKARLDQTYGDQVGGVLKVLSAADLAKARTDPAFRKWAIGEGYEVP